MTKLTTKYSLDISGELPLLFEGEHLETFSSEWCNNQQSDRFHRITLYETTMPQAVQKKNYYIVHVEYETRYQGEYCTSAAFRFPDVDSIKQYLLSYDPLKDYVGLPDEEYYAKERKESMQKLKRDFDGIKVLALKSLGCTREDILDPNATLVSLMVSIPTNLYQCAAKDGVDFADLIVCKLKEMYPEGEQS